MTTTMYDAVDSTKIPTDAAMVAGYVDGRFAWANSDWARFPNATKVHIAVFPSTNDGEVLDCEQGDATPEECPAWVTMRQAAGVAIPTIYCSLAAMPAVQAACSGLTYDLWIADWTGEPHIPDGAMACQYAAKGIYDISLCADNWPRTADDLPNPADPLIGALAYVCDDLGDKLVALSPQLAALKDQLDSIQQEMQRVRVQFLGAR